MIPGTQNIQSGLTQAEMVEAMNFIMEGHASDEDIRNFLVTMADRGETVDEITGAARVLREKALHIHTPAKAIDCCGTGGDARGTYNISTAVAIVAASCGVPVAKHGNRAASSKSGAADVLEALGINLNISKEQIEAALEKFNFAFLMAPNHHHAMKSVSAVRKSLGRRTIFNLLGPLVNPGKTQYQLLGVYDKKWLMPMAETLKNLGTKSAWVVHGHDGLDEITTTDKTSVTVLKDGAITHMELSAADFGLPLSVMESLQGGDASENARALLDLLEGKHGAYRNIVLANAAAVLVIHGDARDLKHGVAIAADSIDTGAALATLEKYKDFTRSA